MNTEKGKWTQRPLKNKKMKNSQAKRALNDAAIGKIGEQG